MKDLAQFFKALSDQTRIFIIALLLIRQELCVCDIENVLEINQSKVSRHLRYLLNSGILKDQRKNVWVYYRINEDLTENERAILDLIKENLDRAVLQELHDKLINWLKSKNEKYC